MYNCNYIFFLIKLTFLGLCEDLEPFSNVSALDKEDNHYLGLCRLITQLLCQEKQIRSFKYEREVKDKQ